MDHSEEFVWRGDGEEAEVVVFAPDEKTSRRAFDRALPAAKLPGCRSPVYACASGAADFGCVAASVSHVAPDLASVPARSVLLVADTPVRSLGISPEEMMNEVLRGGLSESSVLRLNAAGVRRVCELGANAAAEDGLIEEEDLQFLAPLSSEPDALGRRAVSAGERDWNGRFGVSLYSVEDIFDSEGAESLGLEPGMLVVEVRVEALELGRISLALHRERITNRVKSGEFDSTEDLPAAPLETEEAHDLRLASMAAANFADGRAALSIHALRRALRETAGRLDVRAAWRLGGVGKSGDIVVHRRGLAERGEGEILISGGAVAGGMGTMYASVPPFGVSEDGRWLWEEAGLLERWGSLNLLGGEG